MSLILSCDPPFRAMDLLLQGVVLLVTLCSFSAAVFRRTQSSSMRLSRSYRCRSEENGRYDKELESERERGKKQ